MLPLGIDGYYANPCGVQSSHYLPSALPKYPYVTPGNSLIETLGMPRANRTEDGQNVLGFSTAFGGDPGNCR